MSEHDEQAGFFEWAAYSRGKYPELDFMFAIPNGGLRHVTVAQKLKAEGVRPGVPDTFLPVARGGYHGLWIEFKFERNKLTELQEQYARFLVAQGYCIAVCYTREDAQQMTESYLKGLLHKGG